MEIDCDMNYKLNINNYNSRILEISIKKKCNNTEFGSLINRGIKRRKRCGHLWY